MTFYLIILIANDNNPFMVTIRLDNYTDLNEFSFGVHLVSVGVRKMWTVSNSFFKMHLARRKKY